MLLSMSEVEGDTTNQTTNPPVSEVFVLAKSTDEGDTLASNGDFAPRKTDEVTIVSNDDSTFARSQNDSDSSLFGRMRQYQASVGSNAGNSGTTRTRTRTDALARYGLTYTRNDIKEEFEKMTEAQREQQHKTDQLILRQIHLTGQVKGMRNEMNENHQATMAGQREILKSQGEMMTTMKEQPDAVAAAVMERMTPLLNRFIGSGRLGEEDSGLISASTPARGTARTPARTPALRRTPRTASRSTRRSEKRTRPPSSAVMSSRKSASIPGFDGHVERMRRGEEDE